MKICVSLASNDPSQLLRDVERAFSSRADLAEIRFDYLDKAVIKPVINKLTQRTARCVFTLRPKSEGGMFSGTEEERVELLCELARAQPALVDIELDTLKNNDQLADYVEESGARIIVSWHDFQRTPESSELSRILDEMRVFSNHVKLVTMANNVEDSIRLLGLYEFTQGLSAIIFGMGETGVISRILCTLAGSAPFTYAALDKPVAPGQLRLSDMRMIYDRITAAKRV